MAILAWVASLFILLFAPLLFVIPYAMRKLDSALAKRLGLVALEGIPSVARAFSSREGSWMTEAGIQILSILCKSVAQEWRSRELSDKYRLGSYAYRIRHDPSLAQARAGALGAG